MDIPNYSKILFNLPGELIYRQAPDSISGFRIRVDENILSILDIKVEGESLKISCNKDFTTLSPSLLTVYTNSSYLSEVKLKGKVHLTGTVESEKMFIGAYGSGISNRIPCIVKNYRWRLKAMEQ